jgi:hypothetical protein
VTGSGYGGSPLVALAVRAACVLVVLALLPSGCIFHLDDPVPVGASGGASGEGSGGASGAGGAPSGGGTAGSSSGGTSAGGGSGASATGGAVNCPGAKRCDTGCVQIDDPAFGCSPNDNECAACGQPASTKWSCSGGKCVIDSCLDGFGDCDGQDSNGCEIEFGQLPQPSIPMPPVEAFRTLMHPDWTKTTARRQPISGVCRLCTTQSPIPEVVDTEQLPPIKDLQAWFRTAWNESSLYVVVEVRDDELVPAEKPLPPGELGKLGPSVVEDAVELLISLDRSTGGFGVDDMQLFYGLDGTVGRPNQSVLAPAMPPNTFAVATGHRCYTVDVELRFLYMATKPYTPMQGDIIGFTAAIDDWDYLQADGGRVPQRQSHIFSKNTDDQYWVNASSFALLTLGGPPL